MTQSNNPESPVAHGSIFLKVFGVLCALTVLSVAIAMVEIFPDKTTQWAAFIGVAFIKAALVVAYFMHLRWEKYWKYFLTAPALLLGFVLAASLIPDIGNRSETYSNQRFDSGPDPMDANSSDSSADPMR